MKGASTVGIALYALAICGCAAGEVAEPRVEPTPVVARADFELPTTVGPQALPSRFVGVVVTPHQIESLSAPGQPLTIILDDPEGLAARKVLGAAWTRC